MSYIIGKISKQEALKKMEQEMETAHKVLINGNYSKQSVRDAEKIMQNSLRLLKGDTSPFSKKIVNDIDDIFLTMHIQKNNMENNKQEINELNLKMEKQKII